MSKKKSLFDKRKLRNRLSIKKNIGNKLRLSVFRSNKHIYCQIIDDLKQITLCSSSTLDPEVKKDLKSSGTIDAAEKVGKDIAKKAKKIGFEKVVFDRGGYLYHGRVRSLAEGARSSGLKF
jgi:large subunit ribosomal protein L18